MIVELVTIGIDVSVVGIFVVISFVVTGQVVIVLVTMYVVAVVYVDPPEVTGHSVVTVLVET